MGLANLDQSTISVAMCTYNGARFLPGQLDSICKQTILPAELVIQDDGSSDDTAGIVARFASKVPFPVRFVVNAQRKGPARNFEACIVRCTGDIVILTDQDDIWLPDRIERTIAAYKDARVTFTYADAPLIDDRDALIGRTIFATVPVRRADRHRLAMGGNLLPLILRYGVLYGATMSIRRDVIQAASPFPEGWSHDEWLSLVGAAMGCAVCMMPVMHYRQHDTQVIGAGVAGVQAILVRARHHSVDFYNADRARYEAAVRTAGESPLLTSALRPYLAKKYQFLLSRQAVQKGGLAAIRQSLINILQGNYGLYAGGLRSIAKDLALASRNSLVLGNNTP